MKTHAIWTHTVRVLIRFALDRTC